MEIELEPRVKPLPYKVKATSRESTSQKATHVLDTDLRNHWSTATNTKEWILLELDEPCLLSHIRIYNKSVLEWEISVGLRYKPETFVKIRPRCEAPRRDMIYPTNYTPTRYVRISCLRGNPIAVFFIELIGVSVAGLESEFQPVVNHLLPHIISHKQEAHDMHLQLLQEMTSRLVIFLPQLEADLNSFSDAAESNTRFLAMLAGPFYPILHIVNERETARLAGNGEPETSKNSPPSSTFTVSSNFESRRSRNASPLYLPTSSSVVFRPDVIFSLLRKAYQDSHLGTLCRMACRILMKLVEPIDETLDTTVADVALKSEPRNYLKLVDYSSLFGEEFCIPDDSWDSNYLNLLDIKAVEEGILHVLYACASQPLLCSKLADDTSDFWSALPLVQALLPALRPTFTTTDMVDHSFSQWKQPFVQHALSQIVATSSSSVYRPLLHACAGYLSSYSPSHARAACVLIDFCSGLLAPWIDQVLAKVDLAMELLEDLLGVIQGARHSLTHARAALNYIVLALSGHMDDIMPKYKEVKHQVLFLIEMLEPFLDPAITPLKSTIAFGNVSPSLLEKQEQSCLIALNVIRSAVIKSAILPSLESEWKRGSVAPSVLLSVLEPHIQLPPDIDHRKVPLSETTEPKQLDLISEEDSEGKTESSDSFEDIALLFAPQELKNIQLSDVSVDIKSNNSNRLNSSQQEPVNTGLDSGYADEYSNLNLDYSQLMNYRDCELLASEFRRLASDLHAQNEVTLESHNASINALLLAAECYVNPFFVMSFKDFPRVNHTISQPRDYKDLRKILTNNNTNNMEHVAHLERKRDKVVIQILLEAAKLEMEYKKTASNDKQEESLALSDADAITLVRQNQALLCEFLIQRLQKEKNSVHEILIQSLVFLLHSATKLHCSPEDIIDIILESAENFNVLLTSFYHQFKEGNLHLYPFRVHEIQRKWMLLQSLVIASSGNEEDQISKKTGFFHFSKLVPSSVWMHKIKKFASSPCPIIRFLGWMAVSRNANQYKKEKLFLTSNLSDLTVLLSIFADDLAVVERNAEQYLHNLYPDICQFLPNTKKEFELFGEIILEAVGLQLRSLSSSIVPDILCWFSDLCLWPFTQKSQNNSDLLFKGFVAKNAKAIILYVLESIIIEHMEAIVPEIPRVVQVLVSLCKASYCDVDFLESILRLLKPIISYSLSKVSEEEKESDDKDSCLTFEYLCFEELFNNIRLKDEDKEDKSHSKALAIYILASVFTDLSFPKKREILQSLILCADFALFDSTPSCYDYICAFQSVLDSCKGLLLENLRARGALPLKITLDSDINSNSNFDEISKIHPWFPDYVNSNQMGYSLSDEEVMNFSNDLEDLISELNPTVELCWKLHHVLAKKLALTSAQCYMYSKILSSIAEYASISPEGECVNSLQHWKISLKELTETILVLQDKNCWEIASIILDSVLEMPRCFDLSNVIGSICKSIDKFSSNAPKITWRLQSDKWLSNLLTRGAHTAQGSETPLVNLLCKMLGHAEPEQRFIALQHLGKLVGQGSYGGAALTSLLDLVVSGTWDRVAVLATSDSSLHLRTRAIILLLDYVPFAERRLLQFVLISADSVLHDLKSLADNNCEGPLVRVSLALIAHVCLYSPSEDISLIPQSIWRNIESLGKSETVRNSGDVERKACQALCRLKNEGDKAKEILKEVLATTSSKEVDPEFGSTRESILQVLANLTSVQSYFDVFSKKIDQKDMELEEAEIEIDLLQKEQALRDSSNDVNDWCQLPFLATYAKKDENRLQQIKDSIRSLEKVKLKEEIISRRQKKLLLRQERQMYLEAAALRETELLHKLDSERTSEVEREIQRQQMLEIERAKTRELRHNLEIEKEKQSQRELQRELEQAESGIRPSRREFPSSHSSRGRDRFRERENNRQSNEVNTRTSSAGSHSEQGNAPSSSVTGAPAVILSGSSRTYTGQTPTILQPSRDRQDDGGSGYEEGSRDSGDTGSVGDPDLVSALEGQAAGFGSGQRHGSRGGKARQIMERRERESGGGRREGKWERKH